MSWPRFSAQQPHAWPSLGLLQLESREVPANIALQAGGIVAITGDAGNDTVRVSYATTHQTVNGVTREVADTTKIDVSMAGDNGNVMSRQYGSGEVKKISFAGRGGSDLFLNSTTVAATTGTTNGGTISSSVLPGSPKDANSADQKTVGVFVVGSTGTVQIDYLYCGAGYQGQLGLYSLDGMDKYTPGSTAYIKEAARRVLSNSTDGRLVINRSGATDQARYGVWLPWEGFSNSGGTYRGPQSFAFKPGEKLGAMLVPNARVQDVYNNPTAGGATRPLFSIPAANPYTVTPQMLGQMGDLTGVGSVFAFEDLRLDQGSDNDYDDLVFQITGARAAATPVSDVINRSMDFTATAICKELVEYANKRLAGDSTTLGNFQSGKYAVDASGKIGIDFLYDGGGFVGQVGMFSLQGMGQYDPQSPEFTKEAIRRVLSDSALGHTVIDDYADGAKISASDSILKSSNAGTYRGIRSFTMTAGDTVGFVLIPNGALWESFSNPSIGDAKRPLFSLPEANPNSAYGRKQFADADGRGNVVGFEDTRLDGTAKMTSDRDYNDVVFRIYGASVAGEKTKLKEVAQAVKYWGDSTVGKMVRNDSWENWS